MELVKAYQKTYGQDKVTLVTYGGTDGARHGVLLQHPKWAQGKVYAAFQND
jgi:hypothetical protein